MFSIIHVHTYTHAHTCTHIHIYTYTHIHIYTFTHTHNTPTQIHTCRQIYIYTYYTHTCIHKYRVCGSRVKQSYKIWIFNVYLMTFSVLTVGLLGIILPVKCEAISFATFITNGCSVPINDMQYPIR